MSELDQTIEELEAEVLAELEEASEALNFLLSRSNTGKIVLSCN